MSKLTTAVSFDGSTTPAGNTRPAALIVKVDHGNVKIGFNANTDYKTKVKWFKIEDIEVLMGALMDHQPELMEKIQLAKEAVAAGLVIEANGDIVDPKPEAPKPAPKPAPKVAPKRFSLSSVETKTEAVAEAPAPIVPPAPPKATLSIGSTATTAAEQRHSKLAAFRQQMGR